jgi:hypothetical protein
MTDRTAEHCAAAANPGPGGQIVSKQLMDNFNKTLGRRP